MAVASRGDTYRGYGYTLRRVYPASLRRDALEIEQREHAATSTPSLVVPPQHHSGTGYGWCVEREAAEGLQPSSYGWYPVALPAVEHG